MPGEAAAPPLIVGNWKMHGRVGDLEGIRRLGAALASHPSTAAVVICPPATLLFQLSQAIQGTALACGGQTCHPEPQGAYTGEISAGMLRDAGAAHVILGHSERRTGCGETDEQVAARAQAAASANLAPIICVGETLAERLGDRTLDVLRSQVTGSVPRDLRDRPLAVAYEPVWAIGTGQTPTSRDIETAHSAIRISLVSRLGAAGSQVRVLYGGSVTPGNASEILAVPGVGGLLVGRASLNWREFLEIVRAADAASNRGQTPLPADQPI